MRLNGAILHSPREVWMLGVFRWGENGVQSSLASPRSTSLPRRRRISAKWLRRSIHSSTILNLANHRTELPNLASEYLKTWTKNELGDAEASTSGHVVSTCFPALHSCLVVAVARRVLYSHYVYVGTWQELNNFPNKFPNGAPLIGGVGQS
jgi:hypothetical protein